MASLQKISRAYRGKLAENYDTVRDKQIRWHRENEIIARYMVGAKGPVLDCPVGTGRFFALYSKMKLEVVGVDSSDQMLAQAKRKARGKFILTQGNAADMPEYKNGQFSTCVCVRFLNLIDEADLATVMRELTRVTRRRMILTIRLGVKYHSRSSMATHDEKKFRALLKKLGWKVSNEEIIFSKGWHVMQLDK